MRKRNKLVILILCMVWTLCLQSFGTTKKLPDVTVTTTTVSNPIAKGKAATATSKKWVDTSVHQHYRGLTQEQAKDADTYAQAIAEFVLDQGYTTDLEKVSFAALIVSDYCAEDMYGKDTYDYYRSPYGVFVAGVFTCAGSTRALGRVLEYMGYEWQHVNENLNKHQWCVVTMDGQVGFADGMGGFAGYGEMKSGMTLSDGSVIRFAE